jgi:hypothetical protein
MVHLRVRFGRAKCYGFSSRVSLLACKLSNIPRCFAAVDRFLTISCYAQLLPRLSRARVIEAQANSLKSSSPAGPIGAPHVVQTGVCPNRSMNCCYILTKWIKRRRDVYLRAWDCSLGYEFIASMQYHNI